jgi:hypothetical protein
MALKRHVTSAVLTSAALAYSPLAPSAYSPPRSFRSGSAPGRLTPDKPEAVTAGMIVELFPCVDIFQ